MADTTTSVSTLKETGGKELLPSSSTMDGKYSKTTVVYKTVGELSIEATVYYRTHPPPPTARRPAILWIHGGGLVFGTKDWLPSEQLERYKQQGYVVVAMDHRLTPETKIPAIVEDVQDALHWMSHDGASSFSIDPDRIAVVGHSSGGYLALLSGTFSSQSHDRPKAIVSLYGFIDLTGDWTVQPNRAFNPHLAPISRAAALASVGTTELASDTATFDPEGRPMFFFDCKQQGSWVFEATGVDPNNANNTEWFRPYEPIRLVSAAHPHTLLIHGDKDTDVPVQQSMAFSAEAELERNNVPTTLIRHSEWPHLVDMTIADDLHVQQALDQMMIFLQTHL